MFQEVAELNEEVLEQYEEKKGNYVFNSVGSHAGSVISTTEEDELKKKFMQGFDEKKDANHMICKRIRKTAKYNYDDLFENISDLQVYSNMLNVHRVSKFGKKQVKKQSSRILQMVNEEFDYMEYLGEHTIIEGGTPAKISFQYRYFLTNSFAVQLQ